MYAFEHVLMHRVFYQQLSPREKVLYHRRVAELLEARLKSQQNPSRRLVLEAARHFDLGDEPELAVRYYASLAKVTLDSGALAEAIEIGSRALSLMADTASTAPDWDHLKLSVILTVLAASKIHWRGEQGIKRPQLEQWADEAEAIASRVGELALQAQVRLMRGNLLNATRGLAEALPVLRQALELARAAADPYWEFSVLIFLGHDQAGQNLDEGLALMYQAHELYEKVLRQTPPAGIAPAALESMFYQLHSRLGVNEFDRGNHEKALSLLQTGITGLTKLKRDEFLPQPYNFLAQVYIALGLFAEAEQVLRTEGAALPRPHEEWTAWHAYNQALLGKLYLEWGKLDAAGEALEQGWQQSEATRNATMLPLVSNYLAELLMDRRYAHRDLKRARETLDQTLADASQQGTHRSAVQALSLKARLNLYEGRLAEAEACSTEAVAYLERMGMVLPALRTEEVLFTHFQVLQAVGRETEARACLERARDALRAKLARLARAEHIKAFTEAVPLNRAILAAL